MAALVLDHCKKVRTAVPHEKCYIATLTLKKEFFKIVTCYFCCYCWKGG